MKTSKKLSTGVSIGTVYVVVIVVVAVIVVIIVVNIVNVVVVVVVVNVVVVVVVIAEVDEFTFHKKAQSCFSAATAKSTFLKKQVSGFFYLKDVSENLPSNQFWQEKL